MFKKANLILLGLVSAISGEELFLEGRRQLERSFAPGLKAGGKTVGDNAQVAAEDRDDDDDPDEQVSGTCGGSNASIRVNG